MTASVPPRSADAATLAEIDAVLFRPMGADGLKARTGLYENVLEALARWIGAIGPGEAEVFRFPPVMSRSQLERSGYLKSFPNLLGCVCCMQGSEREILSAVNRTGDEEGSWTDSLGVADLVLTPASCYPVYPIAAARGRAPAEGYVFDVGCDCFRREPSQSLDRLQSFRMREFVRVGTADQVLDFRKAWLDRADTIADALGLSYAIDVANDPFFGRGASFLAASQRQQSLKFELLIPVVSNEKPTACMSFNYHQDHFGLGWDLQLADGAPAHTGCVAFGMDRLTLALFVHHGVDLARWPASVKSALGV